MGDESPQTVTLKVGSRTIVVETTPVETASSASFCDKTLVQPHERRLVIKPIWVIRLIGLVLALMACIAAVIALGFLREQAVAFWIVCGIAVPFALAGLLLLTLPRRHDFDLDLGQWTMGCLWYSRRRPLSDILAVQLVPGGWHMSEGETEVTYYTYQLNLVLDDAEHPRRNLSNHANWDWTWDTAQRLAEFLGVPLLDHASARG